uniref:Murine leukemia virus integrase C-terminal domain-containing protein n=1 Tax=Chrysemys picta bellii TaxID=8478 RepID=A0A8C3IC13_CHRPI
MTACQFLSLQARLRTLWKASQFSQTVPLEEQIHLFQPGDFVWAKKFVRGDTLQPRFTGPHQVLLTTQTAVFLEGRKSWIHHSHVKPAVVDHSDGPAALATTEDTASDQWTSLPLSDIRLKLTRKK